MKSNRNLFIGVLLILIALIGICGLIYYFYFPSYFHNGESPSEVQKQAEYKIDHTVTVYIKTGVSETQILVLKNFIESQTGIQYVQYISAEQALENFKSKHSGDQLTLQALSNLETNPIGADLIIAISDPSIKVPLIDTIQSNDKDSIVDRID